MRYRNVHPLYAALPVEGVTALEGDGHARGCQGREYTCTCGYDDRVEAALAALPVEGVTEADIQAVQGVILDYAGNEAHDAWIRVSAAITARKPGGV